MKTITAAQLEAIYNANESVKGTANYYKYHMAYEYKHNGKWMFGGYGVPRETLADLPIRTYGDKQYIMINKERRFTITNEVLELIN